MRGGLLLIYVGKGLCRLGRGGSGFHFGSLGGEVCARSVGYPSDVGR